MRASCLKVSLLALIIGAFSGIATTASAASFLIIPTNQTWKYIVPTDNTFCLNGTGWETPGFDDSAWAGPSPGGFTGGETTAATVTALAGWLNTSTLPAPTALLGRPYYFRTHFNLSSIAGLTLSFTNRVDDQAVWYINGHRVADDAHATDPEACDPQQPGGGEATTNFVFTLSEAQLAGVIVVGDNVLAVSVHQNATGSSDMVFGTTMSGAIASPPTIDYAASSLTNRSVQQCYGSTVLSVSAAGSPAPTYQWFHDGNLIPGATTPTYAINNAQGTDAGSYHVAVTNPSGTTNSTPDTIVTVPADVTPPSVLYAVFSEPRTNIIVVFSEPILTNNLVDVPGNFSVIDTNTSSQVDGAILSAIAPNNTNLVLEIDQSLLNPAHGYALEMTFVTDVCGGNEMPDTTVPVRYLLTLTDFDNDNVWKYDINNGDRFGTGWEGVAYDDSTWPSGPAGLGHESDNNGPLPGNNGVPIRTAIPYMSNSVPTFFRRHVTLNGTAAGAVLLLRDVVEDSAVYYVNGQEAFRHNVGPGVLSAATRAIAGQTDPTPIMPSSGTYLLPGTNLVTGDNVIAVAVIQSGATSSDVEMAVELKALVLSLATPVTRPTLSISRNAGNVTVTWAGGGTLQRSSNIGSPLNWVNIPGATSGFQTNVSSGSPLFFQVTVP